ncbi:MAG: zinc dependent phospholipase C family protein [Treponema sp.]|nr:zinc dependent phospholipase C family protein [Treponema sp.]
MIRGIYRQISGRFGIVADKAMEKTLNAYRTAFALGCQGPDIFYHNQTRRPVGLEYGSLLHRRGYGDFTSVLLKLGLPDPPPDREDIRLGRREKGINALGVYALGFMTHAILDREAHPYIVYKSAWQGKTQTVFSSAQLHAFFERIIDVLMLLHLRNRAVSSWDEEPVLVRICENPPLGLKELLVLSLKAAFPERAGDDKKIFTRMDNTFQDCVSFYRNTNPARTALHTREAPSASSIPYIYPENLPPADYLNLKKTAWQYPLAGRPPDYRSFPEIYADAVNVAERNLSPVITRYLETGLFPIAPASRAIGNGGLSIHDGAGKPCAPTRTAPLPLEEVLKQQLELRRCGKVVDRPATSLFL